MEVNLITIQFISKIRGFFNHLIKQKFNDIRFVSANKTYEAVSWKHKLQSRLIRSKLADFLGIIQILKLTNSDFDIAGSFNRFVLGDKPYFIYLENPTALYHYKLERNKTFLGKRKFINSMRNNKLKSIICMSKACFYEEKSIVERVNNSVSVKVIYPLVPSNDYVNSDFISKRSYSKKLKLLFVTQGSRFVSKSGPETVQVMQKLKDINVELTILTERKDIPKETLKLIEGSSNINLLEFGLSFYEMQKLYAESHILVHLTSDDSFGVTLLEAMKAGLLIISTNLYAIPEMVTDNYNGFLHDPKWWFFSADNTPNPNIWNHRKKTLYNTDIIDHELIDFAVKHIRKLYKNRDLLAKMSNNSLKRSSDEPFSDIYIKQQWENEMINIMKRS